VKEREEEEEETYTEDGQENVDEQVGAAPALEKDTHGREDDGEEDLAAVAGGRGGWLVGVPREEGVRWRRGGGLALR